MEDDFFDVCVVGGGPAGSTIAKVLQGFGHKVALVEKEEFPRPNIGISLTPRIHHFLDLLNVREAIEKSEFIKSKKAIISWSENDNYERENEQSGYHVDRGLFDKILLDSTIQSGVDLYQPFTSKHVKWMNTGNWEIPLEGAEQKMLKSKFIVDATGNGSVLPSKKKQYLPKTICIYAYWNIPELKDHNSYVEAGSNHWYWGAPCAHNTFAACVFVDPKEINKKETSIDEFYLKKLKESKHLNFCLKGNLKEKISTCTTTGFYDEDPIGRNYIKVGNAAYSVDPLSAQGVQKAIASAYQGGIVVNTILSENYNTQDAIEFYRTTQKNNLDQHKKWTQDFYSQHKTFSDQPFWIVRSQKMETPSLSGATNLQLTKEEILQLNDELEFVSVPVINEEYITKKEGIMVPNNPEPFVFLANKHIPELVKTLDNHSAIDVIVKIQTFFENQNPFNILEWLITNNIIVKNNTQSEQANAITAQMTQSKYEIS